MKKVSAKEVIGVIGTIIVGYGVFRRLPRNTVWKKGRITQKTVLVSPRGIVSYCEYVVTFDDGTEERFSQSEGFAEEGDSVEVPYYLYPGIVARPWFSKPRKA